jgi:hypothetical protein
MRTCAVGLTFQTRVAKPFILTKGVWSSTIAHVGAAVGG